MTTSREIMERVLTGKLLDPTEAVCREYNRSVGADGRGLGGLLDGMSQMVIETVIYGNSYDWPVRLVKRIDTSALPDAPPGDLFALMKSRMAEVEADWRKALRKMPASVMPGTIAFIRDLEPPSPPAPAPSPLPSNLFARMERNRSQAVNGAAHFVEME